MDLKKVNFKTISMERKNKLKATKISRKGAKMQSLIILFTGIL